jgi:hypothetical protein
MRKYRANSNLSDEVRADLEAQERIYKKIPRMLSFALLAIELMAPENVFGGRRIRKRAKSL